MLTHIRFHRFTYWVRLARSSQEAKLVGHCALLNVIALCCTSSHTSPRVSLLSCLVNIILGKGNHSEESSVILRKAFFSLGIPNVQGCTPVARCWLKKRKPLSTLDVSLFVVSKYFNWFNQDEKSVGILKKALKCGRLIAPARSKCDKHPRLALVPY